MTAILIIGWFLCGMLGVFLGNCHDLQKRERIDPNSVWFVAAGLPILILVVVLMSCDRR